MAEGRSILRIARSLSVGLKTVEAHIATIFTRLDLPVDSDDKCRVVAVLTWLRGRSGKV
jgi:DNA-binding NarL/FixJ family response regulator